MIRIDVLTHGEDGRARQIEKLLKTQGHAARVRILDVYTAEECKNAEAVGQSLTNPVTQQSYINRQYDEKLGSFQWALEIGFLPGVTDNVGHTAQELYQFIEPHNDNAFYSSRLYLIDGEVPREAVEKLSHALHNQLIERAHIKSSDEFQKDGGMDVVIPKVVLDNKGQAADDVDLNVSDEELARIGKEGIADADGTRRGPLGMSLLYMQALQSYFASEGRAPKDIEIETIAQTWSEHCKHTIFASPIDEVTDGLYKHYIKRATKEIRMALGKNDYCVSVFKDNSGGIKLNDNWLVTDKVETHNSPSALDPFGGSITGIVGVNRDCVGFGRGAKPIINRYGFCLADPRTKPQYYRGRGKTNPTLLPETIMKGVVHGVEVGGNCSGIPSPQGFLYFDDRYVGKPLVFAGTVGLIPAEINGKPGHEKKALPGDLIMMIGGRVGRDGIHGATFSSEALDEGSPATAVQIGDPITQKKLSDAIVKEIRDKGWYNAITDNGAGGLSSSVGEMAEDSGGFHIELERVPLKYPGMSPWEIWISESQERMTMAVPPANKDKIINFLAKRGVEATVVGTYTDTGRAHITWHGETIMDMAMDFLHDGIPETPLKTTFTRGGEAEPTLPEPSDYSETLKALLGRPNIASKEFVAAQYDHNVQGTSVLGPLQGPGRVYSEASANKPLLDQPETVILSQGLAPRYSDIDTGWMAQASLDMAVRNALAAGADLSHLAVLDNFCWCSSDEAERLGQLKRCLEYLYDLAVLYKTPFISGKDSMYNDFKGFDENDNPVKISVPPTLLISAIGVVENPQRTVSIDPKTPGDLVYVLGQTRNELGASEYYDQHKALGNNIPETKGEECLKLYQAVCQATKDNLIASAMAVNFGGLGVTLAKKAIAGQLGLDIDLSAVPSEGVERIDTLLFSETTGRFVVTINPDHKDQFEKTMAGNAVACIGQVTDTNTLDLKTAGQTSITDLEEAYKKTFREF